MDYGRIYREFIADRRLIEPSGYTEKHHILPRSLGGGDEPDNLVRLTPEDHFFAHLLLAKIHGGRMWYPLVLMLRPSRRVGISGRGRRSARIGILAKAEQSKVQLGKLRPDVSLKLRGRPKSEAHKASLSEARKGWKDTPETRAKKSAALASRVYTPERNARVSASLKGREISQEHRRKISVRAAVRCKGAGNPRYDSTVRTFVHEDGRVESLTKFEMAQKHGLNRTCLNYVISGERRHTKGWMVVGG